MSKFQTAFAAIAIAGMMGDMSMPIPPTRADAPMKQVRPRLAVKRAKKARRITKRKWRNRP